MTKKSPSVKSGQTCKSAVNTNENARWLAPWLVARLAGWLICSFWAPSKTSGPISPVHLGSPCRRPKPLGVHLFSNVYTPIAIQATGTQLYAYYTVSLSAHSGSDSSSSISTMCDPIYQCFACIVGSLFHHTASVQTTQSFVW